MKNRIEKLEEQQPKGDHKQQLIELGKQWLSAVKDGNEEAAKQIRSKAEPIFKEHPEWRSRAPFCEKDLFMRWKSFARGII